MEGPYTSPGLAKRATIWVSGSWCTTFTERNAHCLRRKHTWPQGPVWVQFPRGQWKVSRVTHTKLFLYWFPLCRTFCILTVLMTCKVREWRKSRKTGQMDKNHHIYYSHWFGMWSHLFFTILSWISACIYRLISFPSLIFQWIKLCSQVPIIPTQPVSSLPASIFKPPRVEPSTLTQCPMSLGSPCSSLSDCSGQLPTGQHFYSSWSSPWVLTYILRMCHQRNNSTADQCTWGSWVHSLAYSSQKFGHKFMVMHFLSILSFSFFFSWIPSSCVCMITCWIDWKIETIINVWTFTWVLSHYLGNLRREMIKYTHNTGFIQNKSWIISSNVKNTGLENPSLGFQIGEVGCCKTSFNTCFWKSNTNVGKQVLNRFCNTCFEYLRCIRGVGILFQHPISKKWSLTAFIQQAEPHKVRFVQHLKC